MNTFVFSNQSIILSYCRNIFNCNLVVKGSITELNLPPEEYLATKSNCILEVFGDLWVNEKIYLNTIIVHGNLYCNELDVTHCIVDGDIYVKGNASATSITSGCYCRIEKTAFVDNLTSYGSVHLGYFNGYTLKAVDDIFVAESIEFSHQLISGGDIRCNDYIYAELEEGCERPFDIFAYRTVRSRNINIG